MFPAKKLFCPINHPNPCPSQPPQLNDPTQRTSPSTFESVSQKCWLPLGRRSLYTPQIVSLCRLDRLDGPIVSNLLVGNSLQTHPGVQFGESVLRNKFLVITKRKAICSTLNRNRNGSHNKHQSFVWLEIQYMFYIKSIHILIAKMFSILAILVSKCLKIISMSANQFS